jgi:hypothetical protein
VNMRHRGVLDIGDIEMGRQCELRFAILRCRSAKSRKGIVISERVSDRNTGFRSLATSLVVLVGSVIRVVRRNFSSSGVNDNIRTHADRARRLGHSTGHSDSPEQLCPALKSCFGSDLRSDKI